MEHNEERIDRYFKEHLTSFESNPRETVWEQIAGKLGHNRRNKLVYFVIRIAAGMTILISIGLGIHFLTSDASNQEQLPLARKVNPSAASPDSRAIHPGGKDIPEGEKERGVQDDAPEPHHLELNSEGVAPQIIPETAFIEPDLTNPEQTPATDPLALLRRKEFLPMLAYVPEALDYPHLSRPVPEADDAFIAATDDLFDLPEEKSKNQWSLGSEAAPLYSYRTIASDNLDASTLKDLNQNEAGVLAYAAGMNVAIARGKRFSVESGLYYSRYGQEKNNLESYSYQYDNMGDEIATARAEFLQISNSTGNINNDEKPKTGNNNTAYFTTSASGKFVYQTNALIMPNEETNLSAYQYFDYLEVPLTMKYKLIDRKLDFSVLGGLVTNFLVGNSVVLNKNGESVPLGKTSGINKVNYLGSVGLGLQFPVMPRVSFTFEPRFRYYINEIDNSSQINVHPYSIGIFGGISYMFR
jgi:hypothetical protein